ncbi:MAG: class II fructose-bisphosphatase [Alphaproteobacteria bacterium]|nr:class II fructose-bisphosphatase [Alphaproteobacteria bacterium]
MTGKYQIWDPFFEYVLALGLARVTECGAFAASRMRGRGDEKKADQFAVDAMRRELNRLPIRGRVVIGEGERDEAPMLYIGEEVGSGDGPQVDIALDPLEGTTICAKNLPNSLSVIAVSKAGGMLHAPDVYMEKIAIGPGYPADLVDLDAEPCANILALSQAKSVSPDRITACILDRPRHAELIESVRSSGAAIRLITDGDVAAVIHAATPAETGIDVYMGIGGAPEGILAGAALRCIGGQMQGRLILDTVERRDRAFQMGIRSPEHKYSLEDMVRHDVMFVATGVTDGSLLNGVRFLDNRIITETMIMSSSSGLLRRVCSEHRDLDEPESG